MDRPDLPTRLNLSRGVFSACVRAGVWLVLLGLGGCSWLHQQQGRETEICRNCIENSFTAQQSGDFQEARKYLNQATAVQPGNPEIWWNKAELSIQQDDFPTAITELQRYLELQPNDPQGFLRLAQLYYLQNQYTLADDMLEQARRRSPHHFEAVMLTARLARKQADHQRAISAYYHALQITPQHADATLELAELLISRQEPARAATLLRELSRKGLKDQDLARTHLNLGIAYGQQERWESAVVHLEQAREFGGEPLPRDRYRLAYAHWKAGGSQQALKLLIELADSGGWSPRADALYTTITNGSRELNSSGQVVASGLEIRTAVNTPFQGSGEYEPLFLPNRLISGESASARDMIPPEWALNP